MAYSPFEDFKKRLNQGYYQKFEVAGPDNNLDIIHKYIDWAKQKKSLREVEDVIPPSYLKKEFFLGLEFKDGKFQYSNFLFKKGEWQEITQDEFKTQISSNLWTIKEQGDTYIIFYRVELEKLSI